jgi:hypothetical protein
MGKSKIKINLLLTIVTLFVTIGCDSTEPPSAGTLTLNLEDVSCTEAWITLKTSNLELPANIILYQNSVVQNNILCYGDTLLYVDSLLPNQSYKFQSVIQSINQLSNEVTGTTMDTTSHDFTFETFTFGEHDASFLWDVAIIDENSIYAVGEIYMNDSLGQPDPKRYNAVIWNGNNWYTIRIPYNYQGTDFYHPIQSVFTFESNDIWFCCNGVINWDGNIFIPIPIPTNVWGPYQMNKIWGSNSDDLYIVGDGGNIAYYNGSSWSKIASGTETRINDVWGIISNENKTILYCPVSSFFVPGDKKILKVIDGRVDSVSWNRDVRLYSAWAVNENILYVCGEGAYVNKLGVWNEIALYPVGTNSVRGNGQNDIFIVGDSGAIFHFNGVSWKMLSTPNNKGYSKVAVRGNIVVICGNYQGQGLMEIGIRN